MFRKAYHKRSLSCHPDRVKESEKLYATEKFKVLGKVHCILSDKEKRAIYDQTGTWDDDDDVEFNGRDWMEYWRTLSKKFTLADIEEYEKKYKGSDDELRDLKKAYEGGKGDMDEIYERVPFVKLEDEDRIRDILQKLIDAKELPVYELFVNEPQMKRDRRIRKVERTLEEQTVKSKCCESFCRKYFNRLILHCVIACDKDRRSCNLDTVLPPCAAAHLNVWQSRYPAKLLEEIDLLPIVYSSNVHPALVLKAT
ncbi:DnaJ sub C member 9 [Homalodisca vitripennis]|nr:DnaJ sub C member 9 [Homalodisca vitripennis]